MSPFRPQVSIPRVRYLLDESAQPEAALDLLPSLLDELEQLREHYGNEWSERMRMHERLRELREERDALFEAVRAHRANQTSPSKADQRLWAVLER